MKFAYNQLSGSKGKGKNCKSKLEVHCSSSYHLICMTKWSAHTKFKSTGSVHTLLIANCEDIIKNRNYIKCIIDITLYLSRQGIAFKGHLEDNNSLNQGIIKCYIFISALVVKWFYKEFLSKNYIPWHSHIGLDCINF
uniref:Uncharacterized protein n=1 Tax=Schizaphis graminum TaxID=13262 RepID=A0A2S2PHX8_SCHGA